MSLDEIFMRRAIELAKMASTSVFPNPYVGAVITLDGAVLAEGYHQKYGEDHAEVRAVNQIQNKDILKECTIYVTLEPCAHTGKTPPCSELLIRHQFKRVVIGSKDPFSLVNGAGIESLKSAGIEVETGVLEDECSELNERFFTFHTRKRPFITLKWAASMDGFIAPISQKEGDRLQITGQLAHQLVHDQRAKEHAILVGRKTAQMDNPSLDVRLVQGNNPHRFVLDATLKLSPTLKIFQDGRQITVLNCVKDAVDGNSVFISMSTISAETICDKMYKLGILSVYVEGGANTIQQFIDANLWDRCYKFTGNSLLGAGVHAPKMRFENQGKLVSRKTFEDDLLEIYENKL